MENYLKSYERYANRDEILFYNASRKQKECKSISLIIYEELDISFDMFYDFFEEFGNTDDCNILYNYDYYFDLMFKHLHNIDVLSENKFNNVKSNVSKYYPLTVNIIRNFNNHYKISNLQKTYSNDNDSYINDTRIHKDTSFISQWERENSSMNRIYNIVEEEVNSYDDYIMKILHKDDTLLKYFDLHIFNDSTECLKLLQDIKGHTFVFDEFNTNITNKNVLKRILNLENKIFNIEKRIYQNIYKLIRLNNRVKKQSLKRLELYNKYNKKFYGLLDDKYNSLKKKLDDFKKTDDYEENLDKLNSIKEKHINDFNIKMSNLFNNSNLTYYTYEKSLENLHKYNDYNTYGYSKYFVFDPIEDEISKVVNNVTLKLKIKTFKIYRDNNPHYAYTFRYYNSFASSKKDVLKYYYNIQTNYLTNIDTNTNNEKYSKNLTKSIDYKFDNDLLLKDTYKEYNYLSNKEKDIRIIDKNIKKFIKDIKMKNRSIVIDNDRVYEIYNNKNYIPSINTLFDEKNFPIEFLYNLLSNSKKIVTNLFNSLYNMNLDVNIMIDDKLKDNFCYIIKSNKNEFDIKKYNKEYKNWYNDFILVRIEKLNKIKKYGIDEYNKILLKNRKLNVKPKKNLPPIKFTAPSILSGKYSALTDTKILLEYLCNYDISNKVLRHNVQLKYKYDLYSQLDITRCFADLMTNDEIEHKKFLAWYEKKYNEYYGDKK